MWRNSIVVTALSGADLRPLLVVSYLLTPPIFSLSFLKGGSCHGSVVTSGKLQKVIAMIMIGGGAPHQHLGHRWVATAWSLRAKSKLNHRGFQIATPCNFQDFAFLSVHVQENMGQGPTAPRFSKLAPPCEDSQKIRVI